MGATGQDESARQQRHLLFQTRNLDPQRNAADDAQRLRMHADAVQQRRYEGGVVEAGRDERVPQLRVLLLQAKFDGGFDVAHAAQQQQQRFGHIAQPPQKKHLLRDEIARFAQLERHVRAVPDQIITIFYARKAGAHVLAALAQERKQQLRVVVRIHVQNVTNKP